MPRLLLIIAALSALCGLLLIADRRLTRAILARRKAERDAAELRRKLTAPHKPGALTERLRAGRDGYEYTPMPPKRTTPIAYELDEPVRGMRQVTVHDNRVVPLDREVA